MERERYRRYSTLYTITGTAATVVSSTWEVDVEVEVEAVACGKEARRQEDYITRSPHLLFHPISWSRPLVSFVRIPAQSVLLYCNSTEKKDPGCSQKYFGTVRSKSQHPGRRRYCIIRHLTAITSCEIGSEHLTFGELKHTATSNQGVQRRSSKEHPAVLSPTNTTTPLTWTSNTTTQHNSTTLLNFSTSQLLNFSTSQLLNFSTSGHPFFTALVTPNEVHSWPSLNNWPAYRGTLFVSLNLHKFC